MATQEMTNLAKSVGSLNRAAEVDQNRLLKKMRKEISPQLYKQIQGLPRVEQLRLIAESVRDQHVKNYLLEIREHQLVLDQQQREFENKLASQIEQKQQQMEAHSAALKAQALLKAYEKGPTLLSKASHLFAGVGGYFARSLRAINQQAGRISCGVWLLCSGLIAWEFLYFDLYIAALLTLVGLGVLYLGHFFLSYDSKAYRIRCWVLILAMLGFSYFVLRVECPGVTRGDNGNTWGLIELNSGQIVQKVAPAQYFMHPPRIGSELLWFPTDSGSWSTSGNYLGVHLTIYVTVKEMPDVSGISMETINSHKNFKWQLEESIYQLLHGPWPQAASLGDLGKRIKLQILQSGNQVYHAEQVKIDIVPDKVVVQ